MSGVGVADDQREAVRGPAAQQRVEFGELAALALVSHPQRARAHSTGAGGGTGRTLSSVPSPYFSLSAVDSVARERQERIVLRQRLVVGIYEIGEQGEVQMRVAVGEVANLERFDQIARCSRLSVSIVGNDDERADLRRDAC